MANSASTSSKSVTSCKVPKPMLPRPFAIAVSSLSAAPRLGVGCPSLLRCKIVREVVKPSAPALTASAARRAISALSCSVAGSRAAPRSPMTCIRSGACPICAATSISNCRTSSASRYSGNVLQFQGRPSVSTTPGISSTPSMRRIMMSRCSFLQGANPTPQFPMTTVVTPS